MHENSSRSLSRLVEFNGQIIRVLRLARVQRRLLWGVLANLTSFVLLVAGSALGTSDLVRLGRVVLFLVMVAWSGRELFCLALETGLHRLTATAVAILGAVPLIGIFPLGFINERAVQILRKAGTLPGLMGVFDADMQRLMAGACTSCGYDLRGLVSDQCPECGMQRKG